MYIPSLPNCLIRTDAQYMCAWIITSYDNGCSWIEGISGNREIVSNGSVIDLREFPEQQVLVSIKYPYLCSIASGGRKFYNQTKNQ